MSAPQNVIAVIFDFDDTLTDDSTTALLESAGIDSAHFWRKEAQGLIDDGWAPAPAYLKLILDNVGEGKPLGRLTNAGLRQHGASLKFYPGLPKIFADLRNLLKAFKLSRPSIEFYVISGGLQEVVLGSSIAPHLSGAWGCEFAEEGGQIRYVKNVVSFTEKTKYLFQINKGIGADGRPVGPYAVNELVDERLRRVPFSNMIYVGDGFTDVPCFSLIKKAGGLGFGVFTPKKDDSPKRAMERLVAPHRVDSMNAPRYGKRDELGALLRAAVSSVCSRLDLQTRTA